MEPRAGSKCSVEPEPQGRRLAAEEASPGSRRDHRLPPGASRPGHWRTAAAGIPAWLVFGLIWWRAIVEQPDQLLVGASIWAACAVLTLIVTVSWVAWNRSLAHRRERRYGGRSGLPKVLLTYEEDALGRKVEIEAGAGEARHLRAVLDGEAKRISEVV